MRFSRQSVVGTGPTINRPSSRAPTVRLSEAPLESRLRVVGVRARARLAAKLRGLGVVADRPIRLLHRRPEGGVVVALDDDRVALDAVTAEAILVHVADATGTSATRRLWDLAPGDRATIRGFDAGASGYRARLLAMGLLPGTMIEVVRVAPLGDPVELRVRGYELTLRRGEAAVLELEDATS